MAVLDAQPTAAQPPPEEVDPRRWITLAIVLISTLIVVLDNTVLNVAIPTILRDFHTTLPSLEWVITGYALTFATLLIIGGRLCDIYGTRRIFIIGAALFGVGSLLASVSWNVGSLVLGEAIIEGIGASLMLPSALAVLSSAFTGRERGMAFAMWGAVAGSAAGLGPVVGGFLTTDYSWRWAFRINVVIAPLAILGATFFIRKAVRTGRREPLDVPGAALISSGMFLLVFALSEGGTYGWITPVSNFTLARRTLWNRTSPISIVPVIFLAAAAILGTFYRYERRRERDDRSPLFEFGLFKHTTFRYGLMTTTVLSMAALGFSLAMALYLQEALRLSALDNGLWMLPYGLMILVASPIGGALTRTMSTVNVVRMGLVGQTVGLIYIAMVMSSHIAFLDLLPGLVVYGTASGFAFSQLTNVILSDIPADKSGVASGTNTTVRQVGNALGIAVIGTIVTAQTVDRAVSKIGGATSLTASQRQNALAGIHALGANYSPPLTPAQPAGTIINIMGHAVTSATHIALLYAIGVVFLGTTLSFLIPTVPAPPPSLAEDLASLVPLDPEGEFDSRRPRD
jgi:EmrB/QacA subfamily drug resistance transporter